MSSDTLISANNIGKKYRLYQSPLDRLKESFHPIRKKYHHDFWALRNISFQVKKGQTYGIIGKNGSGKSTLLKIVSGVLTPTEGSVHVNGRVSALLELGMGFNPEYSGLQNVYFNGSLLGYSKKQVEQRLDNILEFADIGDFIYQPVKLYSSGMFLRLAFAVSINLDLDILVIDEALAVGDIFFRQKCYKKLGELREKGIPIILVSHAMMDVQQFCERVLVLDEANAIYEGNSSDAVKRYFLLQQGYRDSGIESAVGPLVPRAEEQHTSKSSFTENAFWPTLDAFFDLSVVTAVSNGWARCTGVALCDENGDACRIFEQGQVASFFYEFELSHAIEVPIGGLVIRNDKGILVHGKTTLEYGTELPTRLGIGEKIRFRQDISLGLATGEYVLDIGMGALSCLDYNNKSFFLHSDLESRVTRLCHLSQVGMFSITLRKPSEGRVQLVHHGLCNLPGECTVSVVTTGSLQEKGRGKHA